MEPPPLEYSIFIREVTGNLPEFPSSEKQPYSEGRWFYVELNCIAEIMVHPAPVPLASSTTTGASAQ